MIYPLNDRANSFYGRVEERELISDQKGPRIMARHAATGTDAERRTVRREGALSHRRTVRVTDTGAKVAVVRSDREVLIAQVFVTAVRVVYLGRRVGEAAGGSPARIVELIATHLRGRRGLPRWINDDVETALDYLATEGQITLPEHALAAS